MTKQTTKRQNKKVAQKPGKRKKATYQVRNWHEYNEALKQRGALDVWIEESVVEEWYQPATGKRGAPAIYSDLAITTTLQFGKVFGQKLRQTEGLFTPHYEIGLIW